MAGGRKCPKSRHDYFFLIGIMTDAVTMWESWKAAMELRYIRLKETAEMQ